MRNPEYYTGRLPHYHPPGATLFITCRLQGSLPAHVLTKLLNEFAAALPTADVPAEEQQLLELAAHQRYFRQYEALLEGTTSGPLFLREPHISKLVLTALQHQAEAGHYKLLAACVMPNHLHAVLTLPAAVTQPFFKTWGQLKSFTGKEANRLLGRSGSFWQPEWYDRVVRRGEAGVQVAVKYTVLNPVKAGLCTDWREWEGTWCSAGLPPRREHVAQR